MKKILFILILAAVAFSGIAHAQRFRETIPNCPTCNDPVTKPKVKETVKSTEKPTVPDDPPVPAEVPPAPPVVAEEIAATPAFPERKKVEKVVKSDETLKPEEFPGGIDERKARMYAMAAGDEVLVVETGDGIYSSPSSLFSFAISPPESLEEKFTLAIIHGGKGDKASPRLKKDWVENADLMLLANPYENDELTSKCVVHEIHIDDIPQGKFIADLESAAEIAGFQKGVTPMVFILTPKVEHAGLMPNAIIAAVQGYDGNAQKLADELNERMRVTLKNASKAKWQEITPRPAPKNPIQQPNMAALGDSSPNIPVSPPLKKNADDFEASSIVTVYPPNFPKLVDGLDETNNIFQKLLTEIMNMIFSASFYTSILFWLFVILLASMIFRRATGMDVGPALMKVLRWIGKEIVRTIFGEGYFRQKPVKPNPERDEQPSEPQPVKSFAAAPEIAVTPVEPTFTKADVSQMISDAVKEVREADAAADFKRRSAAGKRCAETRKKNLAKEVKGRKQ